MTRVPGPPQGVDSQLGFTMTSEWTVDPQNPRNWSFRRKAVSTTVVSGIGFISTLAASIYAPSYEAVSRQFAISETLALLPLSFYNLGMAFGPVISSPLSETLGRKAVYLTTTPIFAIFVLGSGFSQNIAALTICRFFAGVFASAGVSLAAATIADIATPVDRAIPLAMYYATPFVGSLLGPLMGGFIVENKGWRWTQWTVLLFVAVFFPPVLFIRETYRKIILKRRMIRFNLEEPCQYQHSLGHDVHYFLTKTVARPIHMLFTEPIVSFVCLYTGFQFALLYTFVVASPHVFLTVYGFSPGAQGLSFIGFIVACLLSPIPMILMDRYVYRRKFQVFKEEATQTNAVAVAVSDSQEEFPPEHRLYCAMIGSVILPVGLFWFSWAANPSVHWICAIVAQAVTMLGSLLIYVSASLYMVDTYGPLYGASATGASSLSRYTLSAGFPLFALQMFTRLGVGWASRLLAFCTLAMAPIPWIFYRWGPNLRARSKYQREN